jgi:UDP-3-O-[3-hydroxymyristoyl] glucosamine N-acyltransferase
LAERVGAVCEGDPDRVISNVAPLDRATVGDLSFCRGGRWAKVLPQTQAGAVLLSPGRDVPEGVVALRHPEPRHAYARVAVELVPIHWPEPGVHPRACVADDATVEGATIGPYAVIEAGAVVAPGAWVMAHAFIGARVRVGKRCRIFPHAVVLEDCTLGDRVWLQPGAVVGADGFGHVPGPSGPIRVPQLGVAVLEDDVEVGANACVDRAALHETRIGRGSRLDNLVQVAHGVKMGAECLLAAFAGVAGGAKLGDRVIMAGRTAVVDGVEVGDGAVFAGLASASRNVPAGRRIGGSPARAYSQWLREVAALRSLPALIRTVNRMERDQQKRDQED